MEIVRRQKIKNAGERGTYRSVGGKEREREGAGTEGSGRIQAQGLQKGAGSLPSPAPPRRLAYLGISSVQRSATLPAEASCFSSLTRQCSVLIVSCGSGIRPPAGAGSLPLGLHQRGAANVGRGSNSTCSSAASEGLAGLAGDDLLPLRVQSSSWPPRHPLLRDYRLRTTLVRVPYGLPHQCCTKYLTIVPYGAVGESVSVFPSRYCTT